MSRIVEEKIVGDDPGLKALFPKIEGVSGDAKEKHLYSFWSSPEKLAADVEKMNKGAAWHDAGWDTSDPGFNGTKNMQEAINLVRYGWKDGAKKAEDLVKRIHAENPLKKELVRYGVAGAYPSVPRAVAGNPLNMRQPDPKKSAKRQVITILSDMGAHCGHKSDEFINRAACVAAIIDQVESAGWACDVVSYCTSQGYDENYRSKCLLTCQVKQSHQPMDIQRLAFGLGHPSMFRRLFFAEKGYHPEMKSLGSGLGYSMGIEEGDLKDKNTYVVPSVNSNYYFKDQESASTIGMQFLINHLIDQGFPPFRGMQKKEIKDDDKLRLIFR